jgi:outer membrane protein assembly factor BamB
VAALGVALGGGFLALGLSTNTALPARVSELEKVVGSPSPSVDEPIDAGPTLAELRSGWLRFRGPDGTGVAATTNAPIFWNGATGQGVAWKSAVPLPGANSPVVWGDRVFLSGADTNRREVFCFDGRNGDMHWRRPVQIVSAAPGPLPKVSEITGFAASTMVTDGRRVFAIFATGELAAFDVDGNPVWTKSLGLPDNPYGFATSLVMWQGRLLVQFDQGRGNNSTKSKLYAFEGATGRVLWERSRPAPSSWATPMVIEAAGRHQLITLGEPWVIAYEAANGSEIWRANCLGSDLAPSPIFAAGSVIVASPWKQLAAFRPDGQGDVTKTHLAWVIEENVPDITSPVANDELLFTVGSQGMLACYDVKDGKKQWEHDLNMECHPSPSLAGNRLYVVGTLGTTVIVAAERQFKELARADLGETIYASPAFVGDRIYLRGTQHLFCIGGETSRVVSNYSRDAEMSDNPTAGRSAGLQPASAGTVRLMPIANPRSQRLLSSARPGPYGY